MPRRHASPLVLLCCLITVGCGAAAGADAGGAAGDGGTRAGSGRGGAGASAPAAGDEGVGFDDPAPSTTTRGGSDGGASDDDDAARGERCGNGLDDDGDGTIDDGCICQLGMKQPCWPGTRETLDRGVCRRGEQTCVDVGTEFGGWGECVGATLPAARETCGDELDDDCNGEADDGCPCTLGVTRDCYPGPAGTQDRGLCRGGRKTCVMTERGPEFGPCDGAVAPRQELCGDGVDEDCDGQTDEHEDCPCNPPEMRACYPAAPESEGRGACHGGIEQCVADGLAVAWGPCQGAVVPRAEACGDALDNDCDGEVDEGCTCQLGEAAECYPADPATRGVGVCRAGRAVCVASGAAVAFGPCNGAQVPGREQCGDALDNDCDGEVDEGCLCVAGQKRGCYDGPQGTEGRGACHGGQQTCVANGEVVSWSACEGAVVPAAEVCGNGADEDCDGSDLECPPVLDVAVNVSGDCLTVCCPASHPFPVGCNLNFSGGDSRGCVAYAAPAQCVYLQEGDACGAGRVSGTLRCSTQAGGALNGGNCPINKRDKYYGRSRSACPDTD